LQHIRLVVLHLGVEVLEDAACIADIYATVREEQLPIAELVTRRHALTVLAEAKREKAKNLKKIHKNMNKITNQKNALKNKIK
jgi:hypothetical protein